MRGNENVARQMVNNENAMSTSENSNALWQYWQARK
jgi:hypothetical protein